MQLTEEIIRRIAPQARADYVAAFIAGGETLKQWGFDTPLRLAALLGNACAETGGLRITSENMNYTAPRIRAVWPSRPEAVKFAGNPRALANSVYGGRMGNEDDGTNDDDGFNYRGRGLGQTTGKHNYREIGRKIGYDLVSNPELLDDPNISLMALCAELSQFLKYCDLGERGYKAVCNGLNRGNPSSSKDPIGWSERQVFFMKALDALGITGKVEDDLMRLGDRGELVKAMQERLVQLGYAAGRADGIYGSRTRAAVLAFQAENGLTTDGLIGPETRTALNSETAVPMPLGERATETAADLREAGSETMTTAKAIKDTAKAVGGISVAGGAAKQVAPADPPPADLISTTKEIATEISSWKAIVSLMTDTFMWATSHWYVFAIVLAFVLHRYGGKIELRRLFDHTSGNNLGR